MIAEPFMLTPQFAGVRRTVDGRLAKVFRTPKHWFSSDRLWPYASRFVRAARGLHERGIATVRIIERLRVAPGRDVVIYQPLPGVDLRRALSSDADKANQWLPPFAAFCAELHRKGIFFRSLHLGNVLHCDDGRFGLIDLVSTSFSRRPLSPTRRARNFRVMFSYTVDRGIIKRFGVDSFVQAYLSEANLNAAQQQAFLHTLAMIVPHIKN